MAMNGMKTGPGRGGPRFPGIVMAALLLVVAVGAPVTAQEPVGTGPAAPRGVLTLQEAVRTAVERNPELQSARLVLEQAQEQVDEAWGNVFPSADLTTTYTRNLSVPVSFLPGIIFDPDADPDELIAVQFGADNLWNLSIDVEQPLFNAAAFIGVGAAGRFESLQEEVLRGELHTVVTRVQSSYFQLLLSQEQERLLENSVRRVEESLRETRALADAGLSSEYDVLRLEVELANLTPNLRRARNAVQQAKRQLGVELDIPPAEAESLEVAGSLATMRLDDLAANSADNRAILAMAEVTTAPAEELVASAMSLRSDVRQLEQTEDLRLTELRLQQVEYLPRISLFGSYGIISQQNGDPRFFGDPRAYNRLIGVRLTFPIFQGFQRDARIDRQRAVLEQARVQTELGRNQVATEVRSLAEQVEEARLRAEAQQLAVTQAQRGFDIARAQYREGLGSQLELTDAEVALRQSEFNYAQAVYDYLVARAQLDAAVGIVPMGEVLEAGA
ncbi:MAG: TolC family protein [Gemmatimonadota bacterium]